MYTYQPDKYQIAIGLPPASVNIDDWVSMSSNKPTARFNYLEGVVDAEPFVELIPSSSRIFNLTVLQTSTQVEFLRTLFTAQLTGILGFPFSIIDNGTDNTSDQRRQRSLYPVSWIVDEPQESFSLQGQAWSFLIQCAGGGTVYL